VVFEITSRSTRREDEVFKPRVYARLGVPEYFLYDPTSDYLKPPLQGFRTERGNYTRITPDETGALKCEQLGIILRLEHGDLVMYDARSGQVLQTEAEAAETRAAELEAEVQRLRAELQRRTEKTG
jgi:hypothetical protein